MPRSRAIPHPIAFGRWTSRRYRILEKVGPQAAARALKDYNTLIAKYETYASCTAPYEANAQADRDAILEKLMKAVAARRQTLSPRPVDVMREIASFKASDVLGPGAEKSSDWVTFRTGQSEFGPTEDQIERSTIRQDGPYRTFWTRTWIVPSQQTLVYNDVSEEHLILWNRKFGVDCAQHKWGPQFIDSTNLSEKDVSPSLQTMTWVNLDEDPVIARVVCEPATVMTENSVPSVMIERETPTGTNFPRVKDYPTPTCVKLGSMPVLATGTQSSRGVDEYAQKLAQYSAAKQAYTACMDTYIANAQADLNRIRTVGDGTSNFSALKDYPVPACAGRPLSEPVPPIWTAGGSIKNAQRVKDYNAEVERYDVYVSCINSYTANAQADMYLIHEKADAAATESKAAQ